MCIYIYIYVYVYEYICMCIYVYIYIYIYLCVYNVCYIKYSIAYIMLNYSHND